MKLQKKSQHCENEVKMWVKAEVRHSISKTKEKKKENYKIEFKKTWYRDHGQMMTLLDFGKDPICFVSKP